MIETTAGPIQFSVLYCLGDRIQWKQIVHIICLLQMWNKTKDRSMPNGRERPRKYFPWYIYKIEHWHLPCNTKTTHDTFTVCLIIMYTRMQLPKRSRHYKYNNLDLLNYIGSFWITGQNYTDESVRRMSPNKLSWKPICYTKGVFKYWARESLPCQTFFVWIFYQTTRTKRRAPIFRSAQQTRPCLFLSLRTFNKKHALLKCLPRPGSSFTSSVFAEMSCSSTVVSCPARLTEWRPIASTCWRAIYKAGV